MASGLVIADAMTALRGRAYPLDKALVVVRPAPGLYALRGSSEAVRALGLPSANAATPLYVGKAEQSLVSRDLRTHFATGKTGQSTLRRSLAALLRDELNLTAIPRNTSRLDGSANFGLDAHGDERLTEWMVRELAIVVWEAPLGSPPLKEVEAEILVALNPPLNLTHVRDRWDVLVKARRAMTAESRQWTP